MKDRPYVRSFLVALLLVSTITFIPTVAAAQDKEQKKILREILAAQDKELEEMVRRFVTIVIPAADKDFRSLRGQELTKNYPGSTRYSAAFAGPEGWSADITDDYFGTNFSCYFLDHQMKSLPELWSYAKDGGDLLKPWYKTLQRLLDGLLKSGWKRKSEEDRRWSREEPATGSRTHWTRQDGLSVDLYRTEHWDPDKDYKRTKGKLLNEIDPSLLPSLNLSLDVNKSEGRLTP